MRLIVISGRSGSGKSTALNALEDEGFNCIDNFPVRLLGSLVADADPSERLAICIDARNRRADLERLPSVLDDMGVAEPGVDCRIVYLDARSPTLVKRFSETRRRHPLTDATTDLREAIDLEREWLAELAGLADLSIDTTTLTAPELAAEVRERLAMDGAVELILLFRSFAYRSGVPVDADFVFDVRCLPNPHWREDLRDLSGLDPAVRKYLDNEAEVAALCEDIRGFLAAWIPKFAAGRRRYLSVAIGCTGGRHRSVYVAERLAAHFRDHSARFRDRGPTRETDDVPRSRTGGSLTARSPARVLLRHRDLPVPACRQAAGVALREASP